MVGLTGSPGVGKSTTTNELVRGAARARAPGRRARGRPVQPVHRRRDPRRPGPDAGPRAPTRASTSGRCPAAATSAGCPRRRRRRSGCWRAPAATWCWWRPSASGRPRSRSPRWPTPRWCCSHPGMGDAIQAVKAGILEIADVFVVNKADRDGADATVRDIQGMIALGERGPGRVAAAGGPGGRRRGARASTTSSPPSTSTGPGWTSTASCAAAGRRGPPPRSRRSRSAPCGPGSAHCATVRSWPRSPRRWPRARLDPYAAADDLLAQLAR